MRSKELLENRYKVSKIIASCDNMEQFIITYFWLHDILKRLEDQNSVFYFIAAARIVAALDCKCLSLKREIRARGFRVIRGGLA